MKIAYLECATGISGDMTLAALLDAGIDRQTLTEAIASLQLPEVQLGVREVMKGAFRALKIEVTHPEQHAHRHYRDIVEILQRATALTPRQRQLAQDIFLAVAQAEATVHGTSVEQIHFHEVGAIDSIVDIVGAAVGFDLLGCERIVCSPIPTGRGMVRIDHGLCPVPTPGTAELLKGIPLVEVPIEAELTTPTGAAIVRTLVDSFGPLPAMTIERIGYGAGTKDFPARANMLRLFVGEAAQPTQSEEICLLETNLDDVTGEVISHTTQLLLAAGARDVYTIPIQMKKGRPATLLAVLCLPGDRERLEAIMYRETGTLGIRRQTLWRSLLPRHEHTVLTSYGPVLGKVAWLTGGEPTFCPEFEACRVVAEQAGCSLREVYRAANLAFDQQQLTVTGEATGSASARSSPAAVAHAHDHDHDYDHDHDHSHRHDHDHDHRQDHDHHH